MAIKKQEDESTDDEGWKDNHTSNIKEEDDETTDDECQENHISNGTIATAKNKTMSNMMCNNNADTTSSRVKLILPRRAESTDRDKLDFLDACLEGSRARSDVRRRIAAVEREHQLHQQRQQKKEAELTMVKSDHYWKQVEYFAREEALDSMSNTERTFVLGALRIPPYNLETIVSRFGRSTKGIGTREKRKFSSSDHSMNDSNADESNNDDVLLLTPVFKKLCSSEELTEREKLDHLEVCLKDSLARTKVHHQIAAVEREHCQYQQQHKKSQECQNLQERDSQSNEGGIRQMSRLRVIFLEKNTENSHAGAVYITFSVLYFLI